MPVAPRSVRNAPLAARKRSFAHSSVLYGEATRQAIGNFPVSGWGMPPEFLKSLALLKEHAAVVNGELGELPKGKAQAVAAAAREVKDGRHADQFPVDVFQTGSGTSTNMNMNEVIASLASEDGKEGKEGRKGRKVHPNDHVNRCQSSNDVIPSALQIACVLQVRDVLLPALRGLLFMFEGKAKKFHEVIKTGRTHLMDAIPLRLGDEFRSYGTLLTGAMEVLREASRELAALPLGGTAVGTGLNAHPEFARKVIARIAREASFPFRKTDDHLATQSCPLVLLHLSSALRQTALALGKAAGDIRLMASGPVAGFNEIHLAPLQAGSSIMPGKTNPVLCESVLQVVSRVIGADATVAHAINTCSNFELCTAYPIVAHELLTAIRLLGNVSRLFADKCIAGIEANEEQIAACLMRNPMLATALALRIGYDAAAKIAEETMASGKTVLEVAERRTEIPRKELERMLDVGGMV